MSFRVLGELDRSFGVHRESVSTSRNLSYEIGSIRPKDVLNLEVEPHVIRFAPAARKK